MTRRNAVPASPTLCVWGTACASEDDLAVCPEPAVGLVAVRDGGRIHKLTVCLHHRLVLLAETAPLGAA